MMLERENKIKKYMYSTEREIEVYDYVRTIIFLLKYKEIFRKFIFKCTGWQVKCSNLWIDGNFLVFSNKKSYFFERKYFWFEKVLIFVCMLSLKFYFPFQVILFQAKSRVCGHFLH